MNVYLYNLQSHKAATCEAAWAPDGWVLAGADLRELAKITNYQPGDRLELYPEAHNQAALDRVIQGQGVDSLCWTGPAFNEGGPVVEVKEHGVSVRTRCAICARPFRPFSGDWPFLKGTWSPVCDEPECQATWSPTNGANPNPRRH